MRQWIRRRLGGYQHVVHAAGPKNAGHGRIAVVGAGLAGLTAGLTLARRGFRVTLLEKEAHLGGKLGAWPIPFEGGSTVVEHGFHAFFRHYYNLNGLLDSLGARRSFRPIEDYTILPKNGPPFRFDAVERTPLLNLLSLTKAGVWNWGQVLANPRLAGVLPMLRYDAERTFERFDGLSFQQWADQLRLPPSMRLVFGSFSRAFFASPDRMSAAELLKSFHSFFLSHDGGLIYDYPTEDFDAAVLGPFRRELTAHGALLEAGQAVTRIGRSGSRFEIGGREFDKVIVACDAASTRTILTDSAILPAEAARRVASLRAAQGYAVLRLWTDRRLEPDVPGFVITEADPLLDSVSFYHRLETESRAWADRTGGGIYELHCYALPDLPEAALKDQFLAELEHYFPELKGMKVLHEHLRVGRDFTSFAPGLQALRPETATGVPGLFLAGDWVKLPFPAMLMEAACSSGLLAANAVLAEDGLGLEEVLSVPLRGLFA